MIRDHLIPRDSANEASLRELENDLPAPLPTQYRSWLKESGGADLDVDLTLPDEEGNAILQELLSPEQAWANYPGTGDSSAIPLEFVMVGYGAGGAICICLTADDYGSVWFADFDLASSLIEDGVRSQEIMIRVADCWNAFLDSR